MACQLSVSKHSRYAYDGQMLVPVPVTQDGPTCVLNAISYGAQMALRHKKFRMHKKSNVVFKMAHFVYLYERETMVRIFYDRSRRIKGAARVFQKFGVEIEGDGVETSGQSHLRLPHFESFPPTLDPATGQLIHTLKFNDVCRMIRAHEAVIGSFATDDHFRFLRPSEIYDFKPTQPTFDTHCVLFVDYRTHMRRDFLKFLNSGGPTFGDGGFGHVYFQRVFQTDEEFCFHTLSFDEKASSSMKKTDSPSCNLLPASYSPSAEPLVRPERSKVVGSDSCINRKVKMTEDDQILGVVRFVAELAWEDAEPTISKAEVTKFCYDAQQHVLAGHWLDIARLMVTSADFFSLDVAEEDMEGLLAVTCSLVTKAASEAEGRKIAELICTILDQQRGYSPSVGLKILYCLHNLIVNSGDKAFVRTKVLEYAAICKSREHIMKDFQNMDEWSIDGSEQKELFADVAGILDDRNE